MSAIEGLSDLHAKYTEMLRMRLRDGAMAREGSDERDVRIEMAALAARFPGALRELDDLELAEIQRRIESLDAVLSGRAQMELWMRAVMMFHALARGALWAKRWLRGRRTVTIELQSAFEIDAQESEIANDVLAWSSRLAEIARPPHGRLMELVNERLAETLGTSQEGARHAVFGPGRRDRPGRAYKGAN